MQRKLSGLKIFAEPFLSVKENLRTGITICEQWVVACEHLTGQVTDSTKQSHKSKQFQFLSQRAVTLLFFPGSHE